MEHDNSVLQSMGGWKGKIREELVVMLDKARVDRNAELARIVSPYDELLLHGQYACANDQVEKAVRSFKECIRLRPDSLIALCAMGRIRMTQGMFVKAEQYFRKAADINPGDFKNNVSLLYVGILNKLDASMLAPLRQQVFDRIEFIIGELGSGIDFNIEILDPARPERFWQKAWNPDAASTFLKQKYTVLHQVLPPGYTELMVRQQQAFIQRGNMVRQASLNRLTYTDMPLAVIANYQMASLVARITGRKVIPTYTFAIHYLAGGFIAPHKDRAQNELSMSLSLAASGDASVLTAGEGENEVVIDLDVNSGLLYRGAEVTHARTPVPEGHSVDQAIFGFRTVHPKHCYCI